MSAIHAERVTGTPAPGGGLMRRLNIVTALAGGLVLGVVGWAIARHYLEEDDFGPVLSLLDLFESLLDEIAALQRAFEEYKARHNLMDYDDLLLYLRSLLRDHDRVRRSLADRYKYLMVDEFQDTNRIQADIVRLLSQQYGNVMVVGDDSQAIYSFRGATVRNILSFPEDYSGCTVIKLEENYRSTQPILNLTNEILRRARA